MSGTSQWEMSEPIMALSSAPNGLTVRVERHRGQRVVRLASEVEAVDKELLDVLGRLDTAGRPLVEHVRRLRRAPQEGAADRRGIGRVPSHHVGHELPVDQGRVEVAAQGGEVALLPVADEVAVERGGPRHAALEKGEVHLRESAGDAAQEERLGQ